jgi:hypothetical protein
MTVGDRGCWETLRQEHARITTCREGSNIVGGGGVLAHHIIMSRDDYSLLLFAIAYHYGSSFVCIV